MNIYTPSHTKKIKVFFYQVSLKLSGYLKNNEKKHILLEFLREDLQKHLLNIVLNEFLFLILDLRKSKLKSSNFIKVDFILKVLIINSETQLSKSLPIKIRRINYKSNDALWIIKLLAVEENYCFKILIHHLIFEDTKILDENKFSEKLIRILLEHLVLKTSEIITRLFLTQDSLDSCFLKSYPKSNFIFSKIVRHFRNNLYWSSYFTLILIHPKHIYNNTHSIWIILNKKICYKNIYLLKDMENLKLTNLQSYTLLYLETVDFFKLKLKDFSILKKKINNQITKH
jgi:hypothetical protein